MLEMEGRALGVDRRGCADGMRECGPAERAGSVEAPPGGPTGAIGCVGRTGKPGWPGRPGGGTTI